MAIWIFEPGHTEAEFRARHMMVTWVRGLFKDIHGRLELDWERCLNATFEGVIDATGVWTGEPNRDAHLRSADFFDVENHPKITFTGTFTERSGADAFKGDVELTIRGTTRTVPLDIAYLGEWKTPFWVGDENRGELRRIGFEATAKINRHDFGVAWQDEIPGGGVVVSNEIQLVLDVEAILLDDLQQTGAIEYYRNQAKELNPRRLWRRLVQIGAGVVVVAVAVVVLTGWGQHGASSVMRTNRGGYRLPWSPTAHQGTRRCRTRACGKKTNP